MVGLIVAVDFNSDSALTFECHLPYFNFSTAETYKTKAIKCCQIHKHLFKITFKQTNK